MRLRYNFQSGLTNATLSSSTPGTSQAITGLFAVAPSFATIVAPDIVVLALEPLTVGQQEIVWLVAYTLGALDGTILRGQEGTAAPSHAPCAWSHDPTALDFDVPSLSRTMLTMGV